MDSNPKHVIGESWKATKKQLKWKSKKIAVRSKREHPREVMSLINHQIQAWMRQAFWGPRATGQSTDHSEAKQLTVASLSICPEAGIRIRMDIAAQPIGDNIEKVGAKVAYYSSPMLTQVKCRAVFLLPRYCWSFTSNNFSFLEIIDSGTKSVFAIYEVSNWLKVVTFEDAVEIFT